MNWLWLWWGVSAAFTVIAICKGWSPMKNAIWTTLTAPYELEYRQEQARAQAMALDMMQKGMDHTVYRSERGDITTIAIAAGTGARQSQIEYLMGDDRVIAAVPYGLADIEAQPEYHPVKPSCPYCGTFFDKRPLVCPQCGAPYRKGE